MTRERRRFWIRVILILITVGAFANSYRHGVVWVQDHSPINGDPYSPFGIAAIPELLLITSTLILVDNRRSIPGWVVGASSVLWTLWVNGSAAAGGISGMVVALATPASGLAVLWAMGHGNATTSDTILGPLSLSETPPGPVVTESATTLGPLSLPENPLGQPEVEEIPRAPDPGSTKYHPSGPPRGLTPGDPEPSIVEPAITPLGDPDPVSPDPEPRGVTNGDPEPSIVEPAVTDEPGSTPQGQALTRIAWVIANGIPSTRKVMDEFGVSKVTANRYRSRARGGSDARQDA